MAALSIRRDRTPTVLRKLAKSEPDARISRRLLGIANALDGMSRAEAAKSAGMDRQTLSDWVIRYNAHGVDGLCGQLGRRPSADADARGAGRAARHRHGRARSGEERLLRLHARRSGGHRQKKFGKSMHPTSMGRVLRRLDLSRQKARPTHPIKTRPRSGL